MGTETAIQELPKELKSAWDIEAYSVKTHEDRVSVGASLTRNKTYQKNVMEFFKPIKDKSWAAHKENCSKENSLL